MVDEKPEMSEFDSVDPAPPSKDSDVSNLRKTICNEDEKMFQRMRALFALRNIGGDDSVDALAAAFSSDSALLKHEIAYVMGQMQNEDSIPHLIMRLEDENEHVMVRHEAAEAIGAIGSQSSRKVLEKFLNHKLPEISESCEVALGLLSYYNKETLG